MWYILFILCFIMFSWIEIVSICNVVLLLYWEYTPISIMRLDFRIAHSNIDFYKMCAKNSLLLYYAIVYFDFKFMKPSDTILLKLLVHFIVAGYWLQTIYTYLWIFFFFLDSSNMHTIVSHILYNQLHILLYYAHQICVVQCDTIFLFLNSTYQPIFNDFNETKWFKEKMKKNVYHS